jgi:hypothetical protein
MRLRLSGVSAQSSLLLRSPRHAPQHVDDLAQGLGFRSLVVSLEAEDDDGPGPQTVRHCDGPVELRPRFKLDPGTIQRDLEQSRGQRGERHRVGREHILDDADFVVGDVRHAFVMHAFEFKILDAPLQAKEDGSLEVRANGVAGDGQFHGNVFCPYDRPSPRATNSRWPE